MENLSTTKMSSKGQVVIPENIRKQLNLKAGTQFVVVGEKDVVILKNIAPPSIDEFGDLIAKARKKGKQMYSYPGYFSVDRPHKFSKHGKT